MDKMDLQNNSRPASAGTSLLVRSREWMLSIISVILLDAIGFLLCTRLYLNAPWPDSMKTQSWDRLFHNLWFATVTLPIVSNWIVWRVLKKRREPIAMPFAVASVASCIFLIIVALNTPWD